MASYDHIAPFYDRIHGDRRASIKYVENLIQAYLPTANTLLSVGCGTGVICKALARHYEITGVDISAEMLTQAKKKLPKVDFYQQDMTKLHLEKKFDVIVSLFGVINHVLTFDDWKIFFRRAHDHLKPGGIFIFDILTELCLYNLIINSPLIVRDKKLTVICDIMLGEEDQTIWDVRGYEVKKQQETLLFNSIVQQISFDVLRIQEALQEIFPHVTLLDPEQDDVSERSELVYFVCQT